MLSGLRYRIRAIFHRQAVDAELEEELRFHIERQIRKLIARGLTEEEAARQARLDFGGYAQIQETCREARGISGLENLWRDALFAARVLRKSPGYTFPILLILIAGIGFSSALFSVLYSLLARPLPYAQADRLMSVEQAIYIGKTPYAGVSIPETERWRRSGAFSQMGVFSWRKVAITGTDEPVPAVGLAVDGGFFQTLGARPFLGRVPDDAAEQAGPPTAVVSFPFWMSHLGGDPRAIGRTLQFDDRSFTIAGVMPPDFRFPLVEPLPGFTPSFWIPLRLPAGSRYDEENRDFEVVARLANGVTPSEARFRLLASSVNDPAHRTISVSPLRESISGNVKPAVPILIAADGLVLLILLANVGSLALARSMGRSHEIAIRLALGASRYRVLQQLAVENCLLGIFACGGGIALNSALVHWIRLFAPGALAGMVQPGLNTPVLFFTAVLAFLLTSIAAIGPVLRISRGRLYSASKAWTGSRAARPRRPYQHGLVSLQIALSLILSIAAGLLFRSLDKLQSADVGFQGNGILTARLSLSPARYASPEQARQFHRAILENIKALPGVRSAALTMTLPFSGRSNMMPVVMGADRSATRHQVERNIVTEEYFRTMDTRLVAGRNFSRRDRAGAPLVAIVNQKMADLWPGGRALGHQFRFAVSGKAPPIRIVGIVENEKHWSVTSAPEPEAYFAFDQSDAGPGGSALLRILTFVAVKGSSGPAVLSQAVKQAVWRVDPREPVEQITPMAELVRRSLAAPRFRTFLLSSYALLAAAIALFGIYSVVAYLIKEREHEFGVRLALGATRYRLLRFALLGCAAKPVLIGTVLGLFGSAAASQTIRAFTYGIHPFDIATYAGVTLVLILFACLAAYLPATQVLRIDPNEILRQE